MQLSLNFVENLILHLFVLAVTRLRAVDRSWTVVLRRSPLQAKTRCLLVLEFSLLFFNHLCETFSGINASLNFVDEAFLEFCRAEEREANLGARFLRR